MAVEYAAGWQVRHGHAPAGTITIGLSCRQRSNWFALAARAVAAQAGSPARPPATKFPRYITSGHIAPLAIAAGTLSNESWGLLMRSGADKSLYARQVERYADVYTSRVSNFQAVTPYAFLRAFRSPLPHDAV